MKILGVDIGSYSVKVAELEASSSAAKPPSLVGFHEFKFSPDPNQDRGLQIIEGLRKLSAQFDPETTRWVIGVPQHRVSVHYKHFPFRERPKIIKSLPFELEDEIPLDIDQTVFDAKIVEYLGNTADVLTIACPKEAVEEALAVSRDGGFDPEIVSVEGLALANLFEKWDTAPPEFPAGQRGTQDPTMQVTTAQNAKLILHLGHSRTNLLVYREDSLVAVRSIQWGGFEVARALAAAFNLPLHEALKTLQSKSFILMNSAGASRDQILMSKTVTSAMDALTRELRLTLLEVKSTFHLKFESLELYGPVGRIQNLGAYLTQALEVPANIGNVLQRLPLVRMETTPQIETASAVAIGLALEGAKRPRNPAVNLRVGEFARENEKLQRLWATWQVPLQVAASLLLLFFVYSFLRDGIASRLVSEMETTLEDVAKEVAKEMSKDPSIGDAKAKSFPRNEIGLQKYVDQQTKLIASRDALAQVESYNSAMDILLKLSEKLPVARPPKPGSGLDVTALRISQENVIIQGRAMGPSVIPQIETALNEIAKEKTLKKADTKGVPTAPTGGTPFAYEFKINRQL